MAETKKKLSENFRRDSEPVSDCSHAHRLFSRDTSERFLVLTRAGSGVETKLTMTG